jgi:hypothetical protein
VYQHSSIQAREDATRPQENLNQKVSPYHSYIFLIRNVLMKPDEETMPDYGHSKGYCLLPNGCPETDPIVDHDAPTMSWKEREMKEARNKARHEKESKVEYIMLQK